MKKALFFVAAVVCFAGVQNASAAFEAKNLSADLEFFTPANASDGLATDLTSLGSVGTLETGAGMGLRVTYLVPVKEFEVGGSIGYIKAPTAEFNGSGAWAGDDLERTGKFIRLMGEAKKEFEINDEWKFKPGIALGLGFSSGEYAGTGAFASTDGESDSWTGISWELSTSFVRKNLVLGLKYTGFPSYENNDVTADVEWTALGLSVGYKFGE